MNTSQSNTIVQTLKEVLLGRSTEEISAALEECRLDPDKAYAQLENQGEAKF